MPSYRVKPTTPRLNPANPLANGLAHAWLMNDSGPVIKNVVNPKYDAVRSLPKWTTGQWGRAAKFDRTETTYAQLSGISLPMPCTLVWVAKSNGTSEQAIIGIGANQFFTYCGFLGTHYVYWRMANGATYWSTAPQTHGNQHRVYVAVGQRLYGLNYWWLYQDGVPFSTNTSGGAIWMDRIGWGYGLNSNADISYLALYNRALSETDVKALSADPFAPYRPAWPQSIIYAALSYGKAGPYRLEAQAAYVAGSVMASDYQAGQQAAAAYTAGAAASGDYQAGSVEAGIYQAGSI